MDLYNKAYFSQLKKKLQGHRFKFNVKIKRILVALIFAFVWIQLTLLIDGFGFLLLLPFVLLVAILQYKSKLAYFAVSTIFISAFVLFSYRSLYYFELLWQEWQGGIIYDCSCCPICEIQDMFLFNGLILVAISILNNKVMVSHYDWNIKQFKKSLAIGLSLPLLLID